MAINIVYYSDASDNYGGVESSQEGAVIHQVLTTPDEWSDDMLFRDDEGREYALDDLVGKRVSVPGIGEFDVPED